MKQLFVFFLLLFFSFSNAYAKKDAKPSTMPVAKKKFSIYLVTSKEGALSQKFLDEMDRSVSLNRMERRLRDTLHRIGLRKIALNQEVIKKHDPYFSKRIKTSRVWNQRRSGRCWMFAAFNVLKPYAIQKMKTSNFQFSENYLFFWDKLERSNLFLEMIIKRSHLDIRDIRFQRLFHTPTSDGGWWIFFTSLVKKYGVVPNSVMPETASSSNTRTINRILTWRLTKGAVKIRQMVLAKRPLSEIRKVKKAILRDVYRVLVYHFGKPPKRFAFRFKTKPQKKKASKKTTIATKKSSSKAATTKKTTIATKKSSSKAATTKKSAVAKKKLLLPAEKRWKKTTLSPLRWYTPKEFAKLYVIPALDSFVTLTQLPSRPYFKYYRLQGSRNIREFEEESFINLPLKLFKSIVLKSILAAEPVWFAADVGQQVAYKKGIMHPNIYLYQDVYGFNLKMDKATRLRYGFIHANHAMVFMGVDMKDKKPVKWLVENSWGKKYGFGGYLHMYDSWFDQYVLMALVHKRYVPKKLLKLLKTKPILIPEEDNLGQLFR